MFGGEQQGLGGAGAASADKCDVSVTITRKDVDVSHVKAVVKRLTGGKDDEDDNGGEGPEPAAA
jgi:hypothetical protein